MLASIGQFDLILIFLSHTYIIYILYTFLCTLFSFIFDFYYGLIRFIILSLLIFVNFDSDCFESRASVDAVTVIYYFLIVNTCRTRQPQQF